MAISCHSIKILLQMAKAQVFTGTITNAILTIEETDGVTMISYKISPTSSANGSVTGNSMLGNIAPTPVTLTAGDGGTIFAPANGFISGLILNAPVGCVINLIALR